jgi:hypothetical protein
MQTCKIEILNIDRYYDFFKELFFFDTFLCQQIKNSDLNELLGSSKKDLENPKCLASVKNILFYKWVYTNGMKSILYDPQSCFIEKDINGYNFVPSDELAGHMMQIKEYFDIYVEELIAKNMQYKLKTILFTALTFDQALTKANLLSEKRIKLNSRIGIDHKDNIIQNLKHGYKLVILQTIYDLDYEGMCIGHCIGEGVLDKEIMNPKSSIKVFSIRKDMEVKDRISGEKAVKSIPFASVVIDNFKTNNNGVISGNIVSIEGRAAGKVKYHLKNQIDPNDTWKGKFPPYIHSAPLSEKEIVQRDDDLMEVVEDFIMTNDLMICGELKYTPCDTIALKNMTKPAYSGLLSTVNDLKMAKEHSLKHIVLKDYSLLPLVLDMNVPVKVLDFSTQNNITINMTGIYDLNELENASEIIVNSDNTIIYCYYCKKLNRILVNGSNIRVFLEKNKLNLIKDKRR